MWYGIISRAQAEHIMRSAAVAGGFVATDIPLEPSGYLAMLPEAPSHGTPMSRAEMREAVILENSFKYLGRGAAHANERGFATNSRIENLLACLDES